MPQRDALTWNEEPETGIKLRSRADDLPTQRAQPVAAVFLSRVPVLAVSLADRADATHDPRARFLLSMVDGQRSVDAILDASSMPTEEGLGILEALRERGVITLR